MFDGRADAARVADTGWLSLSNTLGSSSIVQYRRIGSVVSVNIYDTAAAFASGTTYTVATLPSVFKPFRDAPGSAFFGGSFTGAIIVTGAGEILLAHVSGATRTGCRAAATFMI